MENYLERFNQTTLELIGDLKTVYPTMENSLNSFLEIYTCQNGNRAYMNYFLENVSPYVDLIVSKNIELFDKTNVLSDINIKFIFVETESEPNREVVWKYVEALYLYAQAYMKLYKESGIEDEMKKYMETMGFNQENFNKILENLKTQAEHTANEPNTPSAEKPVVPPEMEKIADSLFGGMIGNLAKEIASEINPSDLHLDPNNPQELLQNLFSPDKGNLMNLVQNISGKLQTKLDKGQLNQQDLFNEATNIMSNLQNMPGMSNMMNNMASGGGMPGIDPTMMAGLMSGLMGGAAKKTNTKNLSLLPKNHPRRRGGNK
jgi:hypothetical protein